ncbi:hypothetical protein AMECASPLE_032412 [Ameca splendens]|uniref:Uncharacterized protein n=1 Tax=Ameca splendens TaxID=208324 RepID=A0ABV0XVE5_9TELE
MKRLADVKAERRRRRGEAHIQAICTEHLTETSRRAFFVVFFHFCFNKMLKGMANIPLSVLNSAAEICSILVFKADSRFHEALSEMYLEVHLQLSPTVTTPH